LSAGLGSFFRKEKAHSAKSIVHSVYYAQRHKSFPFCHSGLDPESSFFLDSSWSLSHALYGAGMICFSAINDTVHRTKNFYCFVIWTLESKLI
jgi:hypothetical protein